jgi:F-type H+-transporting ATPase subunit b
MEAAMPQLQPADFAPQLIWLAIIFASLFFIMSRRTLPRIEKVLGERKTRISGDLESARDAQRQSEMAMERYEAEIASARAKGQGVVRAAREKLGAELSEKRGALDQQLAVKAAATEKRIHGILEQASGEIEAMTSGVVSDIVKKLAGVEASEEEVRAALRQMSKE